MKNCCANCLLIEVCPKREYYCLPGVTMCDGKRECNPCPEFKEEVKDEGNKV